METCPLVSFRETLGLTQVEMSLICQVGVGIICSQERGIPHHLHPKFLRKFPDATELIESYQDYRVSLRRRNFRPQSVVPQNGPEFVRFLEELHMSPSDFSELACMPERDVTVACTRWHLPSTIIRFFEEINDV